MEYWQSGELCALEKHIIFVSTSFCRCWIYLQPTIWAKIPASQGVRIYNASLHHSIQVEQVAVCIQIFLNTALLQNS